MSPCYPLPPFSPRDKVAKQRRRRDVKSIPCQSKCDSQKFKNSQSNTKSKIINVLKNKETKNDVGS
jgi:hypothetical protein